MRVYVLAQYVLPPALRRRRHQAVIAIDQGQWSSRLGFEIGRPVVRSAGAFFGRQTKSDAL